VRPASITFPRPRPRIGEPGELLPTTRPVRGVVVAVPARDEARVIARCLRSIDRAAARVELPVSVVVAADRCRDATKEIARSVALHHSDLCVVSGPWRGASAARGAALRTALGRTACLPPEIWLASTDADCVVPSTWLEAQLAHVAAGADAVAGIVRLAMSAPARLRLAFIADYERADRARPVHAANLGVRVDALERVGGWRSSTVVGEEHALWRGLHLAGCAIVHDETMVVTTSHRTRSRVVGGFASRLARLHADVAGEASA